MSIINRIVLVSSSARVTSAKFQPKSRRELERPGPIDRTPETPGSGKNLMQDQELNLPEHAHCSNIVYSGIPSLVDNHLDPHYMIHEFNQECGPLPTCVLSTLMYQPLGRAGSL